MVVGEAVTEESGLKHKLLNGLSVPSRGHLQVLRPCPLISRASCQPALGVGCPHIPTFPAQT